MYSCRPTKKYSYKWKNGIVIYMSPFLWLVMNMITIQMRTTAMFRSFDSSVVPEFGEFPELAFPLIVKVRRSTTDLRILWNIEFMKKTELWIFKNKPIPAIFYYINTLDNQPCRRGRCVPTFLLICWGLFL